jgi:hypothetical protein
MNFTLRVFFLYYSQQTALLTMKITFRTLAGQHCQVRRLTYPAATAHFLLCPFASYIRVATMSTRKQQVSLGHPTERTFCTVPTNRNIYRRLSVVPVTERRTNQSPCTTLPPHVNWRSTSQYMQRAVPVLC